MKFNKFGACKGSTMITMMKKTLGAAVAVSVLAIGGASASTLDLTHNGFANGSQAFNISSAPVTPSAGFGFYNVGAFSYTDNAPSGGLGDFLAWCLDIEHAVGSGTFTDTDTPFTGFTFGAAQARIQNFFDANFSAAVLASRGQSAAFQAGLWEVLYDDDYSLLTGDFTGNFTASNTGAANAATTFLAAASSYTGPRLWNLSFLESTPGAGQPMRQNLVTVSPVPLPASLLLMLAAMGGMGIAARRRKAA